MKKFISLGNVAEQKEKFTRSPSLRKTGVNEDQKEEEEAVLKKSKIISKTPPNDFTDSLSNYERNLAKMNTTYLVELIFKLEVMTEDISELKKRKSTLLEIKDESLKIRKRKNKAEKRVKEIRGKLS